MSTSCSPPLASKPSPLSASSTPNTARLPRPHEWERATPTRPCAKTIERRWGWRELLAEAIGADPNQIDLTWETLLDVRAQAMLAALAAARVEARPMADRSAVGSERTAAVGSDVRAPRRLGGGVSGGCES